MSVIVSQGAIKMNLQVIERTINLDYFANESERLNLVEVFTTINGSWEPSNNPYSVPQWARNKYLRGPSDPLYHDSAGGDRHIFIGVFRNGVPVPGLTVMYYYDKRNPIVRSTERHGWANIPITGPYYPDEGQCGSWTAFAVNGSHEVSCIGLPENQHVSTYLVYNLVEEVEEPVDPPVDPPTNGQEVDVPAALKEIDDAIVSLMMAKRVLNKQ